MLKIKTEMGNNNNTHLEKEHMPKKLICDNEPIIINHRGSSSKKYKENTLQAFKQAIVEGYKYIELDIVISLDNKILVNHDTINHITGDLICNINYTNELEVETVFKNLPKDTMYLLDLKDVRKESNLIKNLLEICIKYNIVNNCLFASFNEFHMRDLFNYEGIYEIIVKKAYITANMDVDFFEEKIIGWDLTHIILCINQISEELVKNIKEKFDVKIYTYTCNTLGSYEYAKKIGVDAIITDNPELFKNKIIKRKIKLV